MHHWLRPPAGGLNGGIGLRKPRGGRTRRRLESGPVIAAAPAANKACSYSAGLS